MAFPMMPGAQFDIVRKMGPDELNKAAMGEYQDQGISPIFALTRIEEEKALAAAFQAEEQKAQQEEQAKMQGVPVEEAPVTILEATLKERGVVGVDPSADQQLTPEETAALQSGIAGGPTPGGEQTYESWIESNPDAPDLSPEAFARSSREEVPAREMMAGGGLIPGYQTGGQVDPTIKTVTHTSRQRSMATGMASADARAKVVLAGTGGRVLPGYDIEELPDGRWRATVRYTEPEATQEHPGTRVETRADGSTSTFADSRYPEESRADWEEPGAQDVAPGPSSSDPGASQAAPAPPMPTGTAMPDFFAGADSPDYFNDPDREIENAERSRARPSDAEDRSMAVRDPRDSGLGEEEFLAKVGGVADYITARDDIGPEYDEFLSGLTAQEHQYGIMNYGGVATGERTPVPNKQQWARSNRAASGIGGTGRGLMGFLGSAPSARDIRTPAQYQAVINAPRDVPISTVLSMFAAKNADPDATVTSAADVSPGVVTPLSAAVNTAPGAATDPADQSEEDRALDEAGVTDAEPYLFGMEDDTNSSMRISRLSQGLAEVDDARTIGAASRQSARNQMDRMGITDDFLDDYSAQGDADRSRIRRTRVAGKSEERGIQEGLTTLQGEMNTSSAQANDHLKGLLAKREALSERQQDALRRSSNYAADSTLFAGLSERLRNPYTTGTTMSGIAGDVNKIRSGELEDLFGIQTDFAEREEETAKLIAANYEKNFDDRSATQAAVNASQNRLMDSRKTSDTQIMEISNRVLVAQIGNSKDNNRLKTAIESGNIDNMRAVLGAITAYGDLEISELQKAIDRPGQDYAAFVADTAAFGQTAGDISSFSRGVAENAMGDPADQGNLEEEYKHLRRNVENFDFTLAETIPTAIAAKNREASLEQVDLQRLKLLQNRIGFFETEANRLSEGGDALYGTASVQASLEENAQMLREAKQRWAELDASIKESKRRNLTRATADVRRMRADNPDILNRDQGITSLPSSISPPSRP